MQGVCDELKEMNIPYVWSTELHADMKEEMTVDEFGAINVDQDINAVISGIDYSFNFRKLAYGSLYIQKGAHFIASN